MAVLMCNFIKHMLIKKSETVEHKTEINFFKRWHRDPLQHHEQMNERGEHYTVFLCVSESRSDVHMMIKTLFFFSQVEGNFYVNEPLEKLMFEELRNACRGGGQQRFTSSSSLTCWIRLCWFLLYVSCISGVGGFLPAMKQIGNVAALPGIVHVSIMITRSLQTLRDLMV